MPTYPGEEGLVGVVNKNLRHVGVAVDELVGVVIGGLMGVVIGGCGHWWSCGCGH